jgi:hypothetical protein
MVNNQKNYPSMTAALVMDFFYWEGLGVDGTIAPPSGTTIVQSYHTLFKYRRTFITPWLMILI